MRPSVIVLFQCAIVGFVGACSGPHEPRVARPKPGFVPSETGVVMVDVPALLLLSIDELSQRVGPPRLVPASFADPMLPPLLKEHEQPDSTVMFRPKGLAIVASYNHKSRKVSDLLLLGSNEDELMSRGGLQISTPNYIVLPVFQASRPTQLLGVRVLATSRASN